MSEQRFGWPHLLAALMFLILGYGACLFGPPKAHLSPQITALRDSIAGLEREQAVSESLTVVWRQRDSLRVVEIVRLTDSTAKYKTVARDAATAGRRRLDSLALALRARGDTAAASQLDTVVVNIATSDEACALAVSSCQQATDSLKAQVSDRDSILASRDTSLSRAMEQARQGAGLAESAERGRQRAVQRSKVLLVLSAVLGAVAILK